MKEVWVYTKFQFHLVRLKVVPPDLVGRFSVDFNSI